MNYRNYIINGCFIALVVGIVAGTALLNSKDSKKYVVTDKNDKKIFFEDIDDVRTNRIMDFNLDSRYGEYYEYVNVGDTLQGKYLGRDLCMSPCNVKVRPLSYTPKIWKINGRNAHDVIMSRRGAYRDSVARITNMKER